ncbi:MAG: hypothetical protein KBI47_08590 [Armatimonadetes bacterium]|nr:hypothetical protein [Armatimonadota bacterium]
MDTRAGTECDYSWTLRLPKATVATADANALPPLDPARLPKVPALHRGLSGIAPPADCSCANRSVSRQSGAQHGESTQAFDRTKGAERQRTPACRPRVIAGSRQALRCA